MAKIKWLHIVSVDEKDECRLVPVEDYLREHPNDPLAIYLYPEDYLREHPENSLALSLCPKAFIVPS